MMLFHVHKFIYFRLNCLSKIIKLDALLCLKFAVVNMCMYKGN